MTQYENRHEYYGLESLDKILEMETFFDKNFFELLKNWEEILGKRFQNKTEIIKYSKEKNKKILVVGVSSSAMVQELNMFKSEIKDKIRFSIGLNIDDIIFSTKFWQKNKENKPKEAKVIEFYNLKPTKQELEDIVLEKEIIQKIEKSSLNIKDEKIREKFLNQAIKELKLSEWKKQKGFPVCSKCGVVLNNKEFNDKNPLCSSCEFEENQNKK